MLLTLSNGATLRDPEPGRLTEALEALRREGPEFAILQQADQFYLQVHIDDSGENGFDIEYREGSGDRHYFVPYSVVRQKVIDDNYPQQVLDNEYPVLLAFGKASDVGSRAMGPVLAQVAAELSDQLVVATVDVASCPAVAGAWGVGDILPLQVLLHREVPELVLHGVRSKKRILKDLAPFLEPG